jgi:hypothetical protein
MLSLHEGGSRDRGKLEFVESTEQVVEKTKCCGKGVEIPDPLPVQVLERNRLSETEIKAIPRFADYTPGEPNRVSWGGGGLPHKAL